MKTTWQERFWAKVDQEGPTDCWEWTAGRDRDGYGRFKLNGVTPRAHRVSWALHHGPIESGLLVCHTCDNPSCINPSHLFLGDYQSNADDSRAKGRVPQKLTAADVRTIRQMWACDEYKTPELAEMFGVTRQCIWQIVSYKSRVAVG